MDDEEVILIAPDRKNQDGSQTYFILDPCPSEDCVDGPQGIELIDLTDEYQVKNTGAIAVVSTNSTGALEITLKKPEEEMDSNSLPEKEKTSGDSSDSITMVDMITDDDTIRRVKDEDEEVDVEEISLHDISVESNVFEQKSEPELVEISDGVEDHQQVQNDQDDDTEEGTLYIDDAKYSELQDELAQESLQDLNNFKDNVMKQIEGVDQITSVDVADTTEASNITVLDKSDDVEFIEFVDNNKESEIITYDVVSCPGYVKKSSKTEPLREALVHGQLIEIPQNTEIAIVTHEKEMSESTNTALTLLELAGGTGVTVNNSDMKETEDQNYIVESGETDTVKEIEPVNEEPVLLTLQPVQLDPNPAVPITPVSLNPTTKTADANQAEGSAQKVKTDNAPAPKTPVVRMTADELVKRLKDGDTPRQLKGHGRRGREALYMSPLVTQAEIAQEFMDRQLQKTPYTEPSGGDYIFAMKLAHRLATKIVPPETTDPQSDEGKGAKEEDGNSTIKSRKSLSENDSVTKSSESDTGPKKNYALSDKIELLKILEDDPDDASSSSSNQIALEQKVKSDRKKSTQAPLIKMHPELEKELALKQLQDFGGGDVRGRKKVSFTTDKNTKLEKDHERNNNLNSNQRQTNGTKKRMSEMQGKPLKKLKKEHVKAVTADPSQITETLTVEGQTLIDDSSSKDGKSLKQYSNKRLSRSSETPPRLLPMDIVLNGVEDSPSKDESSPKNKIFKATNPKKRKEELQEKRQKHISNVFQIKPPQKRRGRPPKRKSYPSNDELNKEFLLKASLESKNDVDENDQETSSTPSLKDEKPVKTKKMREIERLLGDEGAINMLYSVEQKRASGGESKRGILPSYRRKKKDLLLKTKLVKSAVLRLTTNPPLAAGRVSLRGQTPKEVESGEGEKNPVRKMSVDSHDSHHSLSSPPPESFPFPAKIVPAEASRIIRRHSSSSNYSSRSNSPRRPSVDGERIVLSPEAKTTDNEGTKQKAAKSPQQSSAESLKKSEKLERLYENKCKDGEALDLTPQPEPVSDTEKLSTSHKSKSKLPVPVINESPRLRGRRRIFITDKSKISSALNTSLAAAIEDFAKENKSGGKNIPIDTPKKSTTTAVPSAKKVQRKSTETTRIRTPKPSKVYKEVTLRRHDHIVEICLTPVSTQLLNALDTNVLAELTSVLTGLSKDDNCHVVLLTSQGAVFCQGVDFPTLVKPTPDQRKVAALEMAVAIKDFVKSMAMLARPVVAAVHAPAVGLGVTVLPLCDIVLAAEDATFHTPYTRLGQVPEGAATLTFPSLLGAAVTSELLMACRKMTASQALEASLVTRVLPTNNFHQQVLSVAKELSLHSAQAMNATKALLRHSLLTGLETTLVSESHLLTKLWVSAECQANFTSALEKGEFVLATTPTANAGSSQPQAEDEPNPPVQTEP